MARTLINVPPKAKRGHIIEIKTLISHVMETGYRIGVSGEPIPRDIIDDFVCTYAGAEVFRAKLFPAIAANPFLSFAVVAEKSGTLAMTFTDDHGVVQTETVGVTVE